MGAYPGQVQCILLRNTSATDSSDKFPYNTKEFQGVDDNLYMFFRNSVSKPILGSDQNGTHTFEQDDLANLDLAAGHCRNATIPQNVTYGLQGLPLGINLGSGKKKNGGSYVAPSFWLVVGTVATFMWGSGLGF